MSVYTSRARYVPVEKGFNIKRPPVEPQAFVAEKERAFATDTPTGSSRSTCRRHSAPTTPLPRRSC